MVTVAVAAILFTMAYPSFTTFITNSRIKNVAISLQSGLQEARAQAISSNLPVEFLLFDQGNTLYADGLVGNQTPNTIGPNWLVRTCELIPTTTSYKYTHVDWYNGYEGSGRALGSTLPTAINSSISNSAGSNGCNSDLTDDSAITFNGLGGTKLSSAAIFNISSVNPGDACIANSGAIRCLRVTVSVAGQVKLCDPAVPASDTRAC